MWGTGFHFHLHEFSLVIESVLIRPSSPADLDSEAPCKAVVCGCKIRFSTHSLTNTILISSRFRYQPNMFEDLPMHTDIPLLILIGKLLYTLV